MIVLIYCLPCDEVCMHIATPTWESEHSENHPRHDGFAVAVGGIITPEVLENFKRFGQAHFVRINARNN